MYTSRAAAQLILALRRVEKELLMTAVVFDLDALFEPMTDDEAREIFPAVTRRSPQYPAFLMKVNSLGIGSDWHISLPPDADPEKAARELRYNVNEAAKERTVWKVTPLTEDEQAQYAANKKIDRFERTVPATDDEPEHTLAVTRMKDGKWMSEVSEPIVIRWKIDTRDEEREREKDGKKEKYIAKIPTKMHAHVLATEAIVHRNRGKKEEEAKPEEPKSDAPNVTVVEELEKAPAENLNGIAEAVGAAAQ